MLTYGLVTHMSQLDVHVLTLDDPGAAAFDRFERSKPRRVSGFNALGHRAQVAVLNAVALAEARRVRPAAVLSAHTVTSPGAFIVGRRHRIPFVQYLHGREVLARPRLAAFAVRHAAAVVAVSRYTSQLALERGASPGRIHRIPPGVDPPANGGLLAARADRPTVVTVARMEHDYKGHDILLRAFAQLARELPDARLLVIGDGVLRGRHEELADSLGLRESVSFLGAVSPDERDRLLSEAHVFALPSRIAPDGGSEGFGIVFLEAAAHGLPVVAGNVGGALDAVVDGETGLLVDPNDPAAVAAALLDLLRNPARASTLGAAGLARTRLYSWDRVAGRVEELLLGLIGRA
jgi:phosphatidylinositol alpha-1,6-mannosyltransferase